MNQPTSSVDVYIMSTVMYSRPSQLSIHASKDKHIRGDAVWKTCFLFATSTICHRQEKKNETQREVPILKTSEGPSSSTQVEERTTKDSEKIFHYRVHSFYHSKRDPPNQEDNVLPVQYSTAQTTTA